MQLRINLVNPLAGSNYIKLPYNLECKRALINVKNTDSECFKYAILTKFNNCINKYKFNKKRFNFLEKSSGLNFKCIDHPTPVKQIKIFERVNNVSVNVFGLNDKNLIFPLYVNSIEKKNHFDLFFQFNYCFKNQSLKGNLSCSHDIFLLVNLFSIDTFF